MIDVEPQILSELERMHPLPDGGRADWSDVLRRAGSRTGVGRLAVVRRRWPLIAIGVTVMLAVVLVATPAWALVRDVLPFWGQPSSAPPSVKVEFRNFSQMLRSHAPVGASPDGVSDDWREIEQATIAGETRTLWVAPATGRYDFCWLWAHQAGSCGSSAQPVGAAELTIPPHDPSQPAQTTNIPAGSPTVPFSVFGYATSPAVSRVLIRFSDGSTVQPDIVWVSAPINAGFFAYDIPADQQSNEVHATEIDGYDAHGNLVSKDPI
jgi:hypothetical protein